MKTFYTPEEQKLIIQMISEHLSDLMTKVGFFPMAFIGARSGKSDEVCVVPIVNSIEMIEVTKMALEKIKKGNESQEIVLKNPN